MILFAVFLVSGPGYVSGVKVHGATVFSPGEIAEASNIRTGKPFRMSMVRGGEMRIKALYESRGYFRAAITDSVIQSDKGVEIHLFIDEGPRARLVDIVPTGMKRIDSLSLTRILMRSVPHDLPVPYDEAIIADVEKSLYALYQNSGFPFVEIVSSREEVSPDLVSVTVNINEGPLVRIRDVVVRGNRNVKTDIIQREIDIKPGELYNFAKISEAQRRIYGTGLFASVQYGLDTAGAVDSLAVLYFVVKETKAMYLDLGGGYRSPWELEAKASVGHLNLWGKGQRGEIGGDLSWNFNEFPRKAAHVSYSEPYFLGFRLDAMALLSYSYDVDLDYQEFAANFSTRKAMGKYWSFSPGVKWSYSQRISDTGLTQSEAVNVNAFTQELFLDSRDNIFDPTRGMRGRLYTEEAGWVLGGTDDLFKEFFSLATYSRLTRGGYLLAARVSMGYMTPYGRSTQVPLSERFTLGGDGTVRGYTRYSIGQYDQREGISSGTKLFNTNWEIRKHLTKAWGFAVFVDAGGLWKTYRPITLSEIAMSAGVGIRFYTPIGPLRLDWARPLNSNPGWGIVHLGLGHMF